MISVGQIEPPVFSKVNQAHKEFLKNISKYGNFDHLESLELVWYGDWYGMVWYV